MKSQIFRSPRLIMPLWALVTLAVSIPVSAGTLYRWTDENGQRHMESIIPADQARLGYEVLDDQNFRVIKRVERELTADELAAAEKARQIEEEKQRLAENAARHDRTLLATYMSVDDMQMALQGQLRTLESIIESTERTRARLKDNLDDLIASAANYSRDGRKVPKSQEQGIADVRAQIERQTEIIEDNREKQRLISEQFESDIVRFKQLKGIVDTPAPQPPSGLNSAVAADQP